VAKGGCVSTTAFDVAAVRARFPALARPTAFLDGPAGTQVPDSVLGAMDAYLRERNANTGGSFAASVETDALIAHARETGARFLGAGAETVVFGPSMTSINFNLTRSLGRELHAGDEILVTRLDHDANVSPWLELARDLDLVVRFVEVHDDCSLDMESLTAQLGDPTRVVAFPLASNAVGTVPDARRIVELAHEAGALAWADAVHYAPHGPIDFAELGADLLLCSPYKFYGPHMGLAVARPELLERLRPYKVRPAPDEPLGARFEHGTLQHELLAGLVAAVEYVEGIGWEAILAHERALSERFLAGLPDGIELHGLRTVEGRTPTFAFSVPGRTSFEAAEELAARDIAVWPGDYYAFEIMQRLGLGSDGAVRAGFVHYTSEDEVDRLLEALAALA
jgi:cysteine desulfurase family protein (TIGR01976 family)